MLTESFTGLEYCYSPVHNATSNRRLRRQFVAEFGDYSRQCGQSLLNCRFNYTLSVLHYWSASAVRNFYCVN